MTSDRPSQGFPRRSCRIDRARKTAGDTANSRDARAPQPDLTCRLNSPIWTCPSCISARSPDANTFAFSRVVASAHPVTQRPCRRHRTGLCRPPACHHGLQSRLPGHRLRHRSDKDRLDRSRPQLHRSRSRRDPWRGVQGRAVCGHIRLFPAGPLRRHCHLRPDTPDPSPRPGHVLCPQDMQRDRPHPAPRPVDRAGIDHLPRHDGRTGQADARGRRLEVRSGLLPRLFTGAGRSGQSAFPDVDHSESRRRRWRARHIAGKELLRRGGQDGRARIIDGHGGS